MLKKIIPNLVHLGNCRLEWRDNEPLAVTSNETKAIERIECIGYLEINIDREAFCEPTSRHSPRPRSLLALRRPCG